MFFLFFFFLLLLLLFFFFLFFFLFFFFFFFFFFNNYVSLRYIQLSLGNSCHLFVEELPTLLAIRSFSGCLIVLACLSLCYWGIDEDLIVSVPEFTYLL